MFQKEFAYLGYYRDVPQSDREVFNETDDKVMHVSLPISKETVLMGADNKEAYTELLTYSNFSIIVHADTKQEADKLFNGLSEKGQIKAPMNLTFWSSYYGIVLTNLGLSGR